MVGRPLDCEVSPAVDCYYTCSGSQRALYLRLLAVGDRLRAVRSSDTLDKTQHQIHFKQAPGRTFRTGNGKQALQDIYTHR